jgi:long-chain fatty acid transport protein
MDIGGGNNIGVAIYGNGGQNADYTTEESQFAGGALGGGTASSNIMQLFTNFSFASKLSETSSWGASIIVAVQSLELKGLAGFAANTESVKLGGQANNLTNNGADWAIGGGLKLGYLAALTDTITIGISGQSKMYMTDHDDYTDVLTNTDSLDIPATATVGLTWAVTPKSKFLLDYQYIWYASIETLGNDDKVFGIGCGVQNNTDTCVGGPDGPGFGWNNMGIVKVGWEWEANPEWTWRVGYSHGNQPIPRTQTVFNILSPATIEDHVTFGFTKTTGKDSEVNFSAMYAPKASVSGTSSNSGVPGVSLAPVTLEMQQYQLEASWTSRF